jgi:integrase
MCVTALRRLKSRMLKKHLIEPDLEEGPDKGVRGQPKRRALTDNELAEVFSTVTTGGDDPVLDLALTWAEFELAARRGGIISLTIGELNREAQMIGLFEKGDRYENQPCSLDLIDFLTDFAASRGGDICVPGTAIFDPNAPVFYFKDSTVERPHAVTSRRFDTLHRRIQLALPWANSMSYSGHALRHTIGTIVERQAGFEVAKRMLRHGGTSTTDTYVMAGPAEVAKAISKITGRPHPLARDD